MKIKISNFENSINLSEEYVRVLEIEDKALFANVVRSINELCNKLESKEYIVLLDQDKELDFSKAAYFIIDILNINFNDRKILNKLYSRLKEDINLDLEVKCKLEVYFKDIFNILDEKLMEYTFEFSSKTELEVEELFKLYGIRIYNMEQSFLEKVMYFLDLISLLDLCDVVIFCNLKTFFTNEEIEEIYKHIIHNKIKVLLIENGIMEDILNNEKKLRIDSYFDDYEL